MLSKSHRIPCSWQRILHPSPEMELLIEDLGDFSSELVQNPPHPPRMGTSHGVFVDFESELTKNTPKIGTSHGRL